MATEADIKDRLDNWEFKQAFHLINISWFRSAAEIATSDTIDEKKFPQASREIIEALAQTFGDCGWMPEDSAMGKIIQVVVNQLVATAGDWLWA